MTINETSDRLILKWNHPPGGRADSVLRANGFQWNQALRAWEKEKAPGLKEAILTALGYRPAPPPIPKEEKATAATVERPAAYRVEGLWDFEKKFVHRALVKYMRALRIKEMAMTVEEYENRGIRLVYRHKSGHIAFGCDAVMFCHDQKPGTSYIISQSFMKKGENPKVSKEN